MTIKSLFQKFTHNMSLKILAIVISFIVWVAVVNSQDPVKIVTFYDIPVTTVNIDSLTAKDKIPEIVEGETITVSVEARKSICDKLTSSDISAIADFSKVSITDAVPIDVSVLHYDESDVDIIRGHDQVMKLSLEDYSTKEFKINIEHVGEAREGYVVGKSIASPNVISVSGSKTTIGSIAGVKVRVDVENRANDFVALLVPVAYDNNGEIIDKEKLTFSEAAVDVSTVVLRTRTVNVFADTMGEVADGYEITGISLQPGVITVAGTTEDLLTIGASISTQIDVTGATSSIEKNLDVRALIDPKFESIMIVDTDTSLAVTVHVAELAKKDMYISAANVEFLNAPDKYDAIIKSFTSRKIEVQASQSMIDSITLRDISITADLSMCTAPGDYTVPLIITAVDGAKIKNDINVLVTITEQIKEENLE